MTGQAGATRGGGNKLALVVGINKYYREDTDQTFSNLHGPVQDARAFQRVLIDRFGFAEADIVMLLDEQATHAAIVGKFKEALIDRADRDTEAVFYFAGHGSRVPDRSGKEQDNLDSTFVAYDSRKKGADEPFDIVDDEMYSLLHVLCKKTDRVTVITDSCHSGGVVRGSARTRTAPSGVKAPSMKAILDVLPEGIELMDDDHATRSQPRRYVHLAACLPHQRAMEDSFETGNGAKVTRGLFTWFLCEELQRLRPGTTYATLAEHVMAASLARRPASYQEPGIDGRGNRHVFGGKFGPPQPGFRAIHDWAAGFTVRGGILHGLTEGTTVKVQRVGNREVIGHAVLGKPKAMWSPATWRGPQPKNIAGTAMRAVVVKAPLADPPLVVAVPAGKQWDALATSLDKVTTPRLSIERKESGEVAYALQRDRSGAMRVFVQGSDDWVGEPIPADTSHKEAVDRLSAILANEARWRALMRLTKRKGSIDASVEMTVPSQASIRKVTENADTIPAVCEEHIGRAQVFVDARDTVDVVRLRISIPAMRVKPTPEYHWTVLSVMESRGCNPIGQGVISAGETIPSEDGETGELMIVLKVPDKWKHDRAMRDRYLLILTTRALDTRPLEGDDALVEKGQRMEKELNRRTRSGDDAALPPVLQQALTGRTRGETLGGRRETYGIAFVDILVRKKQP